MDSIPTEITLKVFKHLSQEDIKENVSLTCKRWRCLVERLHLVDRSTVNLSTPFDHYLKKLINDIEKNPSFGYDIKLINMKDQCGGSCQKNETLYFDHGVNKLNTIIDLCSNLEELKIWINSSSLLYDLFTVIFLTDKRFETQLKLLELHASKLLSEERAYSNMVQVNIAKFINHTIPSLQQLVIHSLKNETSEERLVLVDTGLYRGSNTCFIRAINIICPSSIITTSCLEYISSGNLTNLKELILIMTIVRSVEELFDENATVVEGDDAVFNQVRKFCANSLENYNLCFYDKCNMPKFGQSNLESDDDLEESDESYESVVDNWADNSVDYNWAGDPDYNWANDPDYYDWFDDPAIDEIESAVYNNDLF